MPLAESAAEEEEEEGVGSAAVAVDAPAAEAFVTRIAFKNLNNIYEETKPDRSALPYLSSKYLTKHSIITIGTIHVPFKYQRRPAFCTWEWFILNIIHCKEWANPVGTIHRDPLGKLWLCSHPN